MKLAGSVCCADQCRWDFNDRSVYEAASNNRVTIEIVVKLNSKGENVMAIVE